MFLFFYNFVLYLFYHLFLRNQVSFSIVIKLRIKDDLTLYHWFRRALLTRTVLYTLYKTVPLSGRQNELSTNSSIIEKLLMSDFPVY